MSWVTIGKVTAELIAFGGAAGRLFRGVYSQTLHRRMRVLKSLQGTRRRKMTLGSVASCRRLNLLGL